jgi:transcriptional regulator with XRE-family HTH domain
MDNMSTGEKIRYYRKLLNMTQKELAGKNMSVNLVKYLEANKRNLTINKAILFVNTFNNAAMQKGMELNLTLKDFVMSNQETALSDCKE